MGAAAPRAADPHEGAARPRRPAHRTAVRPRRPVPRRRRFDEAFNAAGSFGAEDTDFLHRLLSGGAVVRYAPGAVTWQRYVVTPDQYLRQWKQGGRADAVLTRKHPALAPTLAEQHGAATPAGRLLRRFAPAVPSPLGRALAAPVIARARRGGSDLLTRWAFARVRDALYWRGLAELGGFPRAGAPAVLAYHAIEDVDDAVIGPWCVGPDAFARQLDALHAAGVRFVGVRDVLAWLDGTPLPPRSVLLTFDDGYADLLENAAPLLQERGDPGRSCSSSASSSAAGTSGTPPAAPPSCHC